MILNIGSNLLKFFKGLLLIIMLVFIGCEGAASEEVVVIENNGFKPINNEMVIICNTLVNIRKISYIKYYHNRISHFQIGIGEADYINIFCGSRKEHKKVMQDLLNYIKINY